MTNTAQVAFETNLLTIYPNWDVRIVFAKRSDGEYTSMSSHIGWLSWQASRKQSLEDAIEICHAVLAPFRDAYISGVNRCINRLWQTK
jgi:hypothetical protein